MRDHSYQLEDLAGVSPPFSYDYTVTRSRRAFWTVRAGDGRRVAEAKTRAGARAAVRALWSSVAA